MKNFILAGLLLFLSGCFCIGRCDESPYFHISTNTTTGFADMEFTKLSFISEGHEIMVIDTDGDIFLRGKWIGWDGRLKAFIARVTR